MGRRQTVFTFTAAQVICLLLLLFIIVYVYNKIINLMTVVFARWNVSSYVCLQFEGMPSSMCVNMRYGDS